MNRSHGGDPSLPGALLAMLPLGGIVGCAAPPPPPVVWTDDLAAARSAAGDRLILVQFWVPGQPVSEAMVAETRVSAEVEAAVAGMLAVRTEATADLPLYREQFGQRPGPAVCVLAGDGLVVAARAGYLGPGPLARLVASARRGHPELAVRAAALAALPLQGARSVQATAAFRLAKSFQACGNPAAAHRYYTLVTLLVPGRSAGAGVVVEACARLARIEAENGNPREAREWLSLLAEQGAEVRVDSATVQLTEAILARVERRREDAQVILDALRAEESHPEAARVLLEFGRVCHDAGREAEARQAFEALLERYPGGECSALARRELDHLAGGGRHGVDHQHRD